MRLGHSWRVATARRPGGIGGLRLSFRQLTAADREHVVGLLEGLSDQDRFLRFHRAMPEYREPLIDALVSVDGVNHLVMGAFDGETCVGLTRFVRMAGEPHKAEVAVTVAASYRNIGLGRYLIASLAPAAATRGMEILEFYVHPHNRAAAAMVRSLGAQLVYADGVLEGSLVVSELLDPPPLAA